MNVNTLEDYLYDVNTLINGYNQNPSKADDLRIKISNTLKELDLYDTSTLKLDYLEFKSAYPSLPNPYNESLRKMKSILESKIDVFKHRINKQNQSRLTAIQVADTRKDEKITGLELFIQDLQHKLGLEKANIEEAEETIFKLKNQVSILENKVNKRLTIQKTISNTVWWSLIGVIVALLPLTYDYGKDIAIKSDDEIKISLKNKNSKLQEKIDSLENVIKISQKPTTVINKK